MMNHLLIPHVKVAVQTSPKGFHVKSIAVQPLFDFVIVNIALLEQKKE